MSGLRRAWLRSAAREFACRVVARDETPLRQVVTSTADVAAFEIDAERRIVTIVVLCTRAEALRRLVGYGVHRRWQDRQTRRIDHGRWDDHARGREWERGLTR